jgi:hypothetical protein
LSVKDMNEVKPPAAKTSHKAISRLQKPELDPATSEEMETAHTIAATDYRAPARPRTNPLKYNLAPGILPWDIQPFDTAKSYAAFEVYLALGPGRSLDAVATEMNPEHIPSSTKNKLRRKCLVNSPQNRFQTLHPDHKVTLHVLNNWCSDLMWVPRVRAWDAHLSKLVQKRREDEILGMNVAQSRRFAKLQDVAETAMDKLIKMDCLPTDWRTVSNLLVAGAQGERMARGVVEAIPEKPQTPFNFANLSDQELNMFITLHTKIDHFNEPMQVVENTLELPAP